LDLRRQDQGLVRQDAQSILWHAAIILVILQEVSQRHWVYWIQKWIITMPVLPTALSMASSTLCRGTSMIWYPVTLTAK
jgi:hypothetical protein